MALSVLSSNGRCGYAVGLWLTLRQALEILGLDRLKSALLAAHEKVEEARAWWFVFCLACPLLSPFLMMQCGGTLRQRAERLFALKGKKDKKKKGKAQ